MYIEQLQSIKSWAEDDRPREKLINKGKQSLSNTELLAILLGSGSSTLSAVDLSKTILDHFDNHLSNLAKANVQELTQFKGVGTAKAVSIMASFELSRRKEQEVAQVNPKITSSADAFLILKAMLSDERVEFFYILLLSQSNRLLHVSLVSKGGITATVVDPKVVFKYALDAHACSIILAHNHPSGNVKPSQPDIELTKKIVAAGKILDIKVLDHLIIAGKTYFSFADEGLL